MFQNIPYVRMFENNFDWVKQWTKKPLSKKKIISSKNQAYLHRISIVLWANECFTINLFNNVTIMLTILSSFLLVTWCYCYRYCTSSFNKAWIQNFWKWPQQKIRLYIFQPFQPNKLLLLPSSCKHHHENITIYVIVVGYQYLKLQHVMLSIFTASIVNNFNVFVNLWSMFKFEGYIVLILKLRKDTPWVSPPIPWHNFATCPVLPTKTR